MHEQTAETQISLDIDTVWLEYLLSVCLASPFVYFNFQEFAQIYGNDNRNDKIMS